MAYTVENFKTGKAVREALKAAQEKGEKGLPVFQPDPMGLGTNDKPLEGVVYLEGPHYPKPHRWYLSGEAKDGYLVKLSK